MLRTGSEGGSWSNQSALPSSTAFTALKYPLSTEWGWGWGWGSKKTKLCWLVSVCPQDLSLPVSSQLRLRRLISLDGNTWFPWSWGCQLGLASGKHWPRTAVWEDRVSRHSSSFPPCSGFSSGTDSSSGLASPSVFTALANSGPAAMPHCPSLVP